MSKSTDHWQHAVIVFPWLPLRDPLELGPWRVGPFADFAEPWTDLRFQRSVSTVVQAYQLALEGEGYNIQSLEKLPSVLWHKQHGFNRPPTKREYQALTKAIALVVLDANETDGVNESMASLQISTTENARALAWDLDSQRLYGRFSHGGLLLSSNNLVFLTQTPRIELDAKVNVPLPLSLEDQTLSSAAFRFFKKKRGAKSLLATHWLAKSWYSAREIDLEDRLVLLATGFEALLSDEQGDPSRFKNAKSLRQLFENIGHDDSDLLWRKTESPKHPHGKHGLLTDLEDWFISFATERNMVVHSSGRPTQRYAGRRRAPRYKGFYYWTGERLLREAIKVTIGLEMRAELWKSYDRRRTEAILRELERGRRSKTPGVASLKSRL